MADATDDRTDQQLLAAARQDDREALEALMLRYQPRVYRFGVRMCRDADAAADVLQETMLAMARTVQDFRAESSISTWLYAIARNFCIKKRRRGKFAPAEESLDAVRAGARDDPPDPAPGPEQAASSREIERALTGAIDALDPGQREVLVLRDVEGLPAQEVGAVLGISAQAVKSRLHRARLAVRRRVAPLLGVPEGPRAEPGRCPEVLTLFSRHIEGEIAPDVCARMEAHLERCGACRGACDSLKRVLSLCRTLEAGPVPAGLSQSVRDAIRRFLAERPA